MVQKGTISFEKNKITRNTNLYEVNESKKKFVKDIRMVKLTTDYHFLICWLYKIENFKFLIRYFVIIFFEKEVWKIRINRVNKA